MSEKKHPEYQYLELMQEIMDTGEKQLDKGTGVSTYSVFGRQMRFDLAEGFPLLTTKRVYWKGVLHELYWFFSGQSNIKYLVDNDVHIWDDYPYKIYCEKVERGEAEVLTKEVFIEKIANEDSFAAQHGNLAHIYGEMWRRWPAPDGRKVDQLAWVVDELRKDPDAHNTIVNSWNPPYLYAMAPKGEGARFPICHNMYQVNIKHGKVCLQLYQRSADIFLGVPFNIASYALLVHVIARLLGREVGEFVHTFGDVHIYDNHFDAAREQLARTPHPFPSLVVDDSVREIDDFKPALVTLSGYEPEKTIKAEFVVAGGYNKSLHDS